MRKAHQSIRLFKSDFWERFTFVHPALPIIIWTPIIALFFYRGFQNTQVSALAFTVLPFAGVLVWTLTEYMLHRFAFHWKAESKLGKRFVYIMHGLHHDDANDPLRLVMPPLPAFLYAVFLFFIFTLVLGVHWVEPFFAGFLVGYLCYDYIHYYVHHFNPKNKIGKYLKQYHMLHHYAVNGAKWGVSSPLWDYIFRTVEERK